MVITGVGSVSLKTTPISVLPAVGDTFEVIRIGGASSLYSGTISSVPYFTLGSTTERAGPIFAELFGTNYLWFAIGNNPPPFLTGTFIPIVYYILFTSGANAGLSGYWISLYFEDDYGYNYVFQVGLSIKSMTTASSGFVAPPSGSGLQFTFDWGVTAAVYHWYLVRSQCLPRTGPPITDPTNSACTQGSMTSLTVMASSLNDLANKLINSNWVVPISKVFRYDPPALYADWTTEEQSDPSNRVMVDVTQQFNEVATSLMLFLNDDVNVNATDTFILDMLVTDYYIPVGTTSFRMSLGPPEAGYEPCGHLSLCGTASWWYQINGQSPVFFYNATGALRFGWLTQPSPPSITSPLSLHFTGTSSYFAETWYHGTLIPTNEIGITGDNVFIVDARSLLSVTDESNLNVTEPIVLDSNSLVSTYCCEASSTPVLLFINQNLSQSGNLSNFISRNNLTWNENYPLAYRNTSQSWQTSLFFNGLSTQQDTQQNWQVSFDFGCANPVQLVANGIGYLGIINGGSGYQVNDMLSVGNGGGNVRVTEVSSGVVTAVNVYAPGVGYTVGAVYPTVEIADNVTNTMGSGVGCLLSVTEIETSQAIASIASYWRFAMNISMQDLTLQSSGRTRLILLFAPSVVCPDVRPISFEFTYNVLTQEVTPATLSPAVIYDGLAVFKSQAWTATPLLDITISAVELSEPATVSYPELTNPIGMVRGSAPLSR